MAVTLAAILAVAACGGRGSEETSGSTTRPTSTAPPVGPPPSGIGLPKVADAIEALPHVGEVVELPECQLTIEVASDEIGFAYNSDVLDQRGVDTIGAMAAQLQQATSVEIVGHTSTEGDAAYNQDLSQRRAAAVEGALRAALTAGWAGQVTSRGAGETEPKVSPDPTEADRAANRRVMLSVQFPEEVCAS